MESPFKNNRAYLLSKNIYRLIQFHVQKENFAKYETLKRRMEKYSLCIISLTVKVLLQKTEEERKNTSFHMLHLSYNLLSAYDLSFDMKLIDKKDLTLIESALGELIEEIKTI